METETVSHILSVRMWLNWTKVLSLGETVHGTEWLKWDSAT
jgi:hypothetical protein